MSDMIEVDAEQAAEWLDNLQKENVWLLITPSVRHDDAAHEELAERFIFSATDQRLSGWGDTPQEVKEAVSLWVQEFHGTLRDERSTLHTTKWEVMSDDTPLQKILHIASCEIQRKHPHWQ